MQQQDIVKEINQIGEALPLADNFNPYFWSLMAFNLIVIALVRTLNPGYLKVLFSTAINNRNLVNNIREDLDLGRFSSILLNFTYFTSLAAIIGLIVQSANQKIDLIIIGLLLGAVLIKMVLIRSLAFLSNVKIGFQEHFLNHLIFFQIAGIILTPILIFTHYAPASYRNFILIILIITVVLFIVIREFQSFTRAIQYKISIFYIILYLCTLELLPLVVGIRVFILNSEVLN